MKVSRSTLSLIGERYLDTQHSADELAAIESELVHRRVVGLKRWLLEYVAAASLWWNIIWWDDFNLDGRDIAYGWLGNLVSGLVIFYIAYKWFGPAWASIVLLLAHVITIRIGISIRSKSPGSQEA